MKNKVVRALLATAAVSTVLTGYGPKQEEIVDLYGSAPETEEQSDDIEEVPEDEDEYDPADDTVALYGPPPSEEEDAGN